jgi:hypothetical protein
VALVDVQVAKLGRHALDGLAPGAAVRERVDRRGPPGLVAGVVDERDRGRERVEDARRGEALARVEHGARARERAPREARGRLAEREHAVAELARDALAARAVRADEDRRRERAPRREALRVEHPDARALDDGVVAAQQRAQRPQVLGDAAPRERGLAEQAAPGEAGSDRDGHAAGRHRLERRDRGGLSRHVAQARHEHAGADPDAARRLGEPRERHPHVGVEQRRVVEPDPAVAEALGEPRVLDDARPGRERAGQLHG